MALREAGLRPDTPITYTSGNGEILQAALDKIAAPINLDWVVLNNEVIIFTSPAKAESDQYIEYRVYNVLRRTDATALLKQITSQVAPTAWADNGGCGTIAAWPSGAVVVAQSQKIHRLLEDRFAGLLQRIDPATPKPKQHGHKAENGPAAKLSQSIDLDFVATPLRGVVDHLSQQTKLQIHIDEQGLKGAGLAPAEVQIDIHLRHVSLRTALTLVADQWQLAWVTTPKGVDITSPSVAESRLALVSYDVSDLAATAGNFSRLVEPYHGYRRMQVVDTKWWNGDDRASPRRRRVGSASIRSSA